MNFAKAMAESLKFRSTDLRVLLLLGLLLVMMITRVVVSVVAW